MSAPGEDGTTGRAGDDAQLQAARRQEAFKRVAALVSVPEDAQEAWLESTHYPVSHFVLYNASMLINMSLQCAYFFIGSLWYSSPVVRGLARASGVLVVASLGAQQAMCLLYGPDLAARRPLALHTTVILGSVPGFALLIMNVCSSEKFVPYGNRFVFLLITTTAIVFGNFGGLLSFQASERGPPSTHPAKTALRATMRALRLIDCFSDGMVIRVLWERIDKRECSWFGRNDCRAWSMLMATMATCVVIDFAAGMATIFVGKTMETSHQQGMRRAALTMHLVSFTCEAVIVTGTIVTMLSRGEQSVSNLLFLAASLLTTCAVAYFNVAGSTALVSAMVRSARRVHDGVSRRVSAMSDRLRRPSAGGRSVTGGLGKSEVGEAACDARLQDGLTVQKTSAGHSAAVMHGIDSLEKASTENLGTSSV